MMNDSTVILDLISHTDFAAAIRPTYHCPGAAKLKAYFDHFRGQNPEGTFLLDAGDILVAAPIMHLTQGEPVIDIVNHFGYDAMTLGNHEFDHGKALMRKLLTKAEFPILCSNIIDRETGALLDFVEPYLIIEKKGVKVGILGVTTQYTPFMVIKEAFAPFAVLDVVETCQHYIPIMRKNGADIIIVLSHLPGTMDGGEAAGELFKVANQVKGIDILFGGHNKADLAVKVNTTLISKAGHSAVSIGHVKIAYDRLSGKVDCLVNEVVPVLDGVLEVETSPEFEARVDRIMAPYVDVLDEVLGEALDDLVVDRNGEFSLGNFYTDCMKEACCAEIGLMNSTSCFGYIQKGPITTEMIMYLMCFNDHLYMGTMTGKQLRALFERTYDPTHRMLNGTVQFSGLRVVVDSRKPEGERVISLTLSNGAPVVDHCEYQVATSAYIASGGNDYREIISQTDWAKTEYLTHPVFIDKMRTRKTLDSKTEGRLVDLAESI